VNVCPLKAIANTNNPDKLEVDRDKCNGCGQCIEICKEQGTGALQLAGKYVGVKEILSEIEKDRIFYENSGGGVTLSGGEPLLQPVFSLQLLNECQRAGLHTAMETTGYTPFRSFSKILKSLDLVLFDIKHMDSGLHRKLTGVPNKLIIKNATQVSDLKVPMIIRVPLIPGYTDSQSNLECIATFAGKLNVDEIDLLPYHSFGSSKYRRLGRVYMLEGIKPPDKKYLLEIKKFLESSSNLKIRIGG